MSIFAQAESLANAAYVIDFSGGVSIMMAVAGVILQFRPRVA